MNMRVLIVAVALSVSWSAATWAESGVPGHWRVVPIKGSGWWAPVDAPAECEINATEAKINATEATIQAEQAAPHDLVAVPTYRCTLGWWDEE